MSHCPNCFAAPAARPCPRCGWYAGQDNPPPALALGRVLDGRYRIGRVLGHGGFGITYLAWDDNLHLRLAIKEYLPRDSATRGPDGVSLAVYSGGAAEQFAYGLDRFLDEARALARFDQHPGIVTVKNFFRAHGTGYCVMDYVDGITLRQYLEQQPGGRVSVEAAQKLLTPVMDALRAVHKEGLLHRDLAPDNIYLTQDGRIKLLDFGAARFAAGEHSKSLSVILKPGYAPEEQYRTKGRQGPWTDVYGLAATLYRAITGEVPPEALDRLDRDDLVPPSGLGVTIQPHQEAVLLKALTVKAEQRYQGMGEFQQAWRTGETPQPPPASSQEWAMDPAPGQKDKGKSLPALSKFGLLSLLLTLGVLAVLVLAVVGTVDVASPPASAPDPDPAGTQAGAPAPTPTVPGHTAAPTSAGDAVKEGVEAYERGDYERALAILRPWAEHGDASAQYHLGQMYQTGKGVATDNSEAARWLRKAAEQGHPVAQYDLGVRYEQGLGVEKDMIEAARWIKRAAEGGNAQAEAALPRFRQAMPVSPDDTRVRPATNKEAKDYDRAQLSVTTAIKRPIYFAAESAPTANIPPEAPLCYKFLVSGLEEQLGKLRAKYPDLYDAKIMSNERGSETLVAKRRDGSGKEIAYFYSTSPDACDEYQKVRLNSGSADQGQMTEKGRPTKEWECVFAVVKRLGTRLQNTPGSGTLILFDNDVSLVSYDIVHEAEASRKGDKVKICLIKIPKGCPPGDDRGKIYTVINQRTGGVFTMRDSMHFCGGA